MNPHQDSADIVRPALSPITREDHAGQVWILTTLAIIYTGTSLITRGSIKWNLFWLDDYLLVIATAVHFTQAGAVFYGLSNGLAKFNSITTEQQWASSGRALFTSELLAAAALCLSKCSVWALLLRIFFADGAFNDWRVKTCLGFVFLGAAWGVLSVVGIVAGCDPESMLSYVNTSECEGQVFRWQVITAFDAGTEILGSLLPVALVWSLNMAIRSKVQVFIAFSFRLPLVAISILHLRFVRDYPRSAEPLFAVTNAVLCQQAMLTWSLISATIPNIKSFMKVFSFGMGMGAVDERLSNRTPEAIILTPFRDPTTTTTTTTTDEHRHAGTPDGERSGLRPDHSQHRTTMISDHGTTDDEHSLRRHGSQEMIIKKGGNGAGYQ